MTLSVVIPAHNAAETLAETLDCLLAQTRGDWEAVIVDDGSTDTTAEIARAYAARDQRFRLLSDGRAAEGVSAARNRGIAEAAGRWLLFLDSDDWVEPAFAATMLGAVEAGHGIKVAYCSSRRVAADGRQGPTWFSTEVARAPFETFARQCPVAIHAFVLDRAFVVALGGFDAELRTCEDWDFWQRVARTGVAFLPVPDVVAFYRLRRNSLSSDVRSMMADADLVIARAFAPDLRVPDAAPRHIAGADPGAGGTKEMAVAHFALWSAAFDVAEGGDGRGLVRPLPDHWGSLLEACRLNILGGLVAGARNLPDDPFSGGPAFFAAVRGLLGQVEVAAARPGLARLLEFVLEPEVFRPASLTDQLSAGRALFVRQDIAHLQPVAAPAGVDILNIEFRAGGRYLARAEAALFGALSVRELTTIAIAAMSPTVFLRESGVVRRPRFWMHAVLAAMALPVTHLKTHPRRGPRSVLKPRQLARHVLVEAAMATAGLRGSASNDRALDGLVAEGRAQVSAMPPPAAAKAQIADDSELLHRNRRDYWEKIYRTADPWAYGSDYEQTKYRRTLDLLPTGPIDTALELACSEGMFTKQLAPRVGRLTAADISQAALDRARARCAGLANVDYRRLDFFDEPLPEKLDLVVCAEVLYYLPDRSELSRVAAKLAAALAPGGHLLTAHGRVLKDEPAATGFDWDDPFGAKIIGEVFAATHGLSLERSLRTDLYHVDLFRRLRPDEMARPASIEMVETGPPPEPAYAGSIVWGGAAVRRAEVQARETADRLPILLYHRIADNGPAELARYRTTPRAFAEQMRWLRRHGYHGVTSAELVMHLAVGQPFRGRPVLITFDDAYRDFHAAAWPILNANDFCAEVMVVTDLVGGTAQWDSSLGPPAPLMGWPEIQALAAVGIRFGSHMASHSHMAELSSRQVALEAARSRAQLENALGCECLSVAAPYGESDDRFVHIAARCGYKVGLTTAPGLAQLDGDPQRLPRIEVLGGWSIEAFASALGPMA